MSQPREIKRFGKVTEVMEPPNLMELQTVSYTEFLQADVPSDEREHHGLEAILQEVFPVEVNDGVNRLEYLGYELGRPRYSPDECRMLRLTYGMPFKIRVRLVAGESETEETVYLGEIPKMIGGGEFLVNGAERVIVSQLHRSPGVDFDKEIHSSDRIHHKVRIIPERGSWIELLVSRKDTLTVRIDQSGKFPVHDAPPRALREVRLQRGDHSSLLRDLDGQAHDAQRARQDQGQGRRQRRRRPRDR